MLEVIGLSDVDAYECHELQLGETLARGGRQGEKVAQVGDFCVDEVPSQLAGALR